MNYNQFLDKEGLAYFNKVLNERFQGRLKYIGEFELNDDFTDFNVLAPAHVGDVYHAKAGTATEVVFGETKVKDGDWFVVMNESRVDADDPMVIRVHDNDPAAAWEEGDVKIEKLGSQMDDIVAFGYYTNLRPSGVCPYAYVAHYDDLNYPYAYENFDDIVNSTYGCSAVRTGNMFGRNLDWIYDNQIDFVVKTDAKGGRYATLGVCGQINKLDYDFVHTKEYATEYVLLPFYCVDGINEKHVFVSMNVMPNDPTVPDELMPAGEVYASICANMIPRYILDYCASADEAVDVIKRHLKIHFSTKAREGGFLPHYMVGDLEKTYVVEFVGDTVVATLQDNSAAVMTNFRLTGTTPNADGKYNVPAAKDSGTPSVVNGLDPHAAGVERYNLAKNDIAAGKSLKNTMIDLYYMNTYKEIGSMGAPVPFWYSEYTGMGGTTIDSDPVDFAAIVAATRDVYINRSRDPEDPNFGTWQTKHSCLYDVDALKLEVCFQETADTAWFELQNDVLPAGENDGDALIYLNGQWKIMPQYGYIGEAGNSYDEDITMFLNSDNLYQVTLANELKFIEGETYTIKIGDAPATTYVAIKAGDAPTPNPLIDPDDIIITDEHLTIGSRLNAPGTTLTMDNGTLDPVHFSLAGRLQGDYHTIDPRYIEKIIEEVAALPVSDMDENKIYKTHTPWGVDGIYILSSEAEDAGWTADEFGIHSTDLELDWDAVNADWDNQSALFTAYAGGKIYRFRLSGEEEYAIKYKTGDVAPTHDDRISLYIFDDGAGAYKEIYNSDTSTVGGVANYNNLTNKPRIHNVTLSGNQTSTDLEIAVSLTQAQYDGLAASGVLNPETLYCITDGVATTDTKDYEELMNRPSLEGITLREGLSYNDLGLMGRSEIESKLSSFLTYKGTVNSIADLPTDATQGDVYFVGELQRNYAFNGLVWNDMGGSVDMSIYQKKQSDTLTTTNKSIEGGINELDGRIGKTIMTTAATSVTAAINELDNDKLDVEPGGLNTTATKVVDAINEINDNKVPMEPEFITTTLENLRAGGTKLYPAVKFSAAADSPNGSTTNSFVVEVFKHNANYCSMVAKFCPNNTTWECSYNNGTWIGWQNMSLPWTEGNNVIDNRYQSSMRRHIYYTFGDLNSSNRRGWMKLFELPYLAAYHDIKVNIKLSSSFASNGLNGEMELTVRRGKTSGIATDFNVYSRILVSCDSFYGADAPYIVIFKSEVDYRMHFYLCTDGQYYQCSVDVSYDVCRDYTQGGGVTYAPVLTSDCGVFTTTTPTPYEVSQWISMVNWKPVVTQTSNTKAIISCTAWRLPSSNFYTISMSVKMTQNTAGTVGQISLRPIAFFETVGSTSGGKQAGITLDSNGNVAVHGTNLAVGDQFYCTMTIPCRTV